MDCCKTYLGEFPHNKDIDTGLMTDETGVHEIEFSKINGTKFNLELDIQDPTQSISIPKGSINEDLYYCFTIKKPSGSYIVNENECANFCLKTYIQIIPNCGDNCPE
jgi:actin-related protein